MSEIFLPEESGRVSADVLLSIWRSRHEALTKGKTTVEQFSALSTFCGLVVKSPDGIKLLPELMDAISELPAPTGKLPGLDQNQDRVIQEHGDKLGVVLRCVLQLKGPSGFNELYDGFKKGGENTKLKPLVEGVYLLGESEFLEVIAGRIEQERDPELHEILVTCFDRLKERVKR